MPVAVRRSPFDGTQPQPVAPVPKKPKKSVSGIRPPQLKCLMAMKPDRPASHPINWPVFTRASLCVACGLSPTNSMNRILHGIKDGPRKHPGLIQLGYVEILALDIMGTIEYNYVITPKGLECLLQSGADRS